MALDITIVRDQVDQFVMDTIDSRALSEKCRDYYDHKQWTAEEIRKLAKRNQAPIKVNRIRPKVKGLLGLYNLRRSDPKAFPRTQKHEKASHAITDALRYAADQNDFSSIRLDVAEDFFIEGYSGVSVTVNQAKNGDVNVDIKHIPWDRIYYDPHSRKKDFSDARFRGFYWWMSEDEAAEKFPNADVEGLISESDNFTDETFEDRPRWFDKQRRRVRIAVHFCLHQGRWYFSIFTGNTFLREPELSPYLDEDGEPDCPIELVSANVDRDNQRYGEVLCYLDQQDEINHRRSKSLHLLSQRQTFGRKGEPGDVEKMKRELAKPDGHIEFLGEEFGKDFGILPTGDMAKGQFELYMDAKSELDAVGFNAQLSGERQQGDLSGRAIDKLQAAGTIELNQDYSQLANWEKRVYRQMWARVKQFWTEEKWIRVTDDQKNLRWVGLNTQITSQQFLEENIMDEALPLQERQQYAMSLQFLMQSSQDPDPMVAQAAQQKLQEIVSVSNPMADIDTDIILDQSFDVINAQQEQFELLAKFGQGQDIDIIELIELSDLRNKDQLIEKIEKRRAQMMQAQQGAMEMEQADRQADIQLKGAKAQSAMIDAQSKVAKLPAEIRNAESEAVQREIENLLLVTQPERVNSVSV
jgi:hypothetical protein